MAAPAASTFHVIIFNVIFLILRGQFGIDCIMYIVSAGWLVLYKLIYTSYDNGISIGK